MNAPRYAANLERLIDELRAAVAELAPLAADESQVGRLVVNLRQTIGDWDRAERERAEAHESAR